MLRTQHIPQQGAPGKKGKKGKKKKNNIFGVGLKTTGVFKRAFNATHANGDGIIFEGCHALASARVWKDLSAQAWQIIGFNLSLQIYLWLGPGHRDRPCGEDLERQERFSYFAIMWDVTVDSCEGSVPQRRNTSFS